MQDFFDKISSFYEAQKPFVVYRKPKTQTVNLMVQTDSELHVLIDFAESGFVFAPFESEREKIIFPRANCTCSKMVYKDSDIDLKKKTSNQNFQELPKLGDKNIYLKLVNAAMDFIETGEAEKVVLSRKIEIEQRTNASEILKKLILKYPEAFVYFWHHPKVGTWMGASPEVLVSSENNSIVTMALAGTQKFDGTTEVEWGAKEIREQEIVTDFIVRTLRNIVTEVGETKTIRAGNLLHLRTKIKGKLEDIGQFSEIVAKLHPTPAVCGLPKENAKDFILKYEGYDRKFYTGFLGELNISDLNNNRSSELFVNLRCMELLNDKVSIFVGGGITSKSNPEKEWDEIMAKSLTMRSVLD